MSLQEIVQQSGEEYSEYEREPAFDSYSELVILVNLDTGLVAEALIDATEEQLAQAYLVLDEQINNAVVDALNGDDWSAEYFINNNQDLDTALMNREVVRVMLEEKRRNN
jgi:hypothetical protein